MPCMPSPWISMHGKWLFQFNLFARFWDENVVPAFLAQLAFVELLRLRVTMHDEGLLDLARVLAAEAQQFYKRQLRKEGWDNIFIPEQGEEFELK